MALTVCTAQINQNENPLKRKLFEYSIVNYIRSKNLVKVVHECRHVRRQMHTRKKEKVNQPIKRP